MPSISCTESLALAKAACMIKLSWNNIKTVRKSSLVHQDIAELNRLLVVYKLRSYLY